MFKSKEKKIEKLVMKGNWGKISKKYLNSVAEDRLLLAKKCALSKDPGANNILSTLLRDPDEKVQLAAIKSIGVTGGNHEAAQLEWVLSNTPKEKAEIIEAVQNVLSEVRTKK